MLAYFVLYPKLTYSLISATLRAVTYGNGKLCHNLHFNESNFSPFFLAEASEFFMYEVRVSTLEVRTPPDGQGIGILWLKGWNEMKLAQNQYV